MGRRYPGVVALVVAAATMMAAPARAADMAVPGYYPPKAAYMPPAVYDWTGVYVGGHVGGGWLNDTVTWNTTTPLMIAGSTAKVQPLGFIGGGQVGANFEFSSWVVGVEGTFTASGIDGSTPVPALPGARGAPGTATQERVTSTPQWLATATGRFGYAANTLLIYVKGGGAWMHVEYAHEAMSGAVDVSTVLQPTRSGFVVGAGLEYGMTENLSAKLEYDFYDFGSANYTFTLGGIATPVSVKSQLHAVTVGLNYRWNWAGGWH